MLMSSAGATMVSAEAWAVDTSVAVAALDAGHLAHAACLAAVRELVPALSGHAAFETYSVLTRMPGPLTVDPGDAFALTQRVFPEVVWLSEAASTDLLTRLPALGIMGGSVYDALVGEASRLNDRHLLTRDQRARRTYDLLGVTYSLVG